MCGFGRPSRAEKIGFFVTLPITIPLAIVAAPFVAIGVGGVNAVRIAETKVQEQVSQQGAPVTFSLDRNQTCKP